MPSPTARLSTSRRLKLAYVAIAAADTWLSGSSSPRAHRARVLTKPMLMPTLMASLITDPNSATSPLRTSTLAAQAGGWGGDLALMGDEPKHFVAGSGSFALGHAAYISGFLANRSRTRRPGAKLVVGAWAATMPVMAFKASQLDRRLGPTIAGYSAMLATTVATATQLDPALPRSARRLTLAGAAMFMLSDSILGTRKFLLKNPPPRLESAVMATYTTAQLLMSEGAARAGVSASSTTGT
ncbi:putative membrane protein YhhN [Marmoricola sp. OAE513]|uniref:lysoplasmalogenase n=1 Tax=Marmoricola sp. OAE513 TaxID=2817894 RepID=UPI001AE2A3FD